jgi:hypothetical protein
MGALGPALVPGGTSRLSSDSGFVCLPANAETNERCQITPNPVSNSSTCQDFSNTTAEPFQACADFSWKASPGLVRVASIPQLLW